MAVLLAAYNGARWIEEQLASILCQQGVSVSLFISVDNSTDDTLALCERYQQAHSNIEVLVPAGPFGGAARNFFHLLEVVDFSCVDFISFADQDDLWHIDKLDRATRHLISTGVGGYSSNVTAFWPDGRRVLLDKAQPQVRWDYLFEAAGPGCTYVLKRGLALRLQQEVRLRPQELKAVRFHDWYIYAFARSHGYKWYIDTTSGLEYRQHEGNFMGANVGWLPLQSRLKSVRNGWWSGQIRTIAGLVGQQHNPEVSHWLKLGRAQWLFLALHAVHCRRRSRDRLYFVLLCCVSAVLGSRDK